ncbi:hypothetical protein QVD17_21194 [Tagetes erecta]|uniref:Bifunctional inhibitor/plant lipid transfer protein/seed storage helical domain-containing protein n=1 Tax=Tagetes erecta TaxID=13708 RepID=A0AAD8KN30_TARER|nr:hypothetical protein QVD17_21194 [Tagetes erecta]
MLLDAFLCSFVALLHKSYHQVLECSMGDVYECGGGFIPPSKECCDALKVHEDCYCYYQIQWPFLAGMLKPCNLQFKVACP